MHQTQHSVPIFPEWHEGQKWRVEYLRKIPSTVMTSGGQLPPPERAVWLYQVSHLDPRQGGPIVVSLQEEGGKGKFELSLDPKGLTLLSVSEISGDRKMSIITNSALDSFLSIPTGYPVIFDWARFPVKRSNASRVFRTPEDHRVKEEFLFDGDSHFKISMTFREQRAEGLVQTIHSVQSWQGGRPWWDSASAESEMIVNEEKSLYWSISGKLIP